MDNFPAMVASKKRLGTRAFFVGPVSFVGPVPFVGLVSFVGLVLAVATSFFCQELAAQTRKFSYEPAAVDNPLKGLVPYAGEYGTRFPHSLEFSYLPLNKLMIGPKQFNWEPVESLLDAIAKRGHHAVVRVWVEYPGKNGIPQFLIDDGVKVTRWTNRNTQPLPPKLCWTPDYQDPRVRKALVQFIKAFGKKYDGDPRLGFVTAGLLGTWGEWHCHPRTDLFASKTVQAEVLDAFEVAFSVTPVLLRYPAGQGDSVYSANHRRPFGYHDDSFAWATLNTGKPEDDWNFVPKLKRAEAGDKWKSFPIGGEIRPELWGKIFDLNAKDQRAQDFADCVRQTHVSWLMDSGMFNAKQPADRIQNAKQQVQRMGYEFSIQSATTRIDGDQAEVQIVVKNTGVAPFYYNWDVQLATFNQGKPQKVWTTEWKVTGILPDQTREWTTRVKLPNDQLTNDRDDVRLAVRVRNPLTNGKPFRFANRGQADSETGWFVLK